MYLDLRPNLLRRIILTTVLPFTSKAADELKPAGLRAQPAPGPGTEVASRPRQTPAVKKANVLEHPLAQHALTAMRNKHTLAQPFRDFSNQLLLFLTFEATRSLPTREETVEASVNSYHGKALAKPVVFLSVTRQAMGLAHNVVNFIPDVLVGAISISHRGGSQQPVPRLHLVNAPALSEARVILFDPVVARGFSARLALQLLRSAGASNLTLVSFILSPKGLMHLQSSIPDLTVWTAAIDSEWDSKRGPLPGLGNFAERMYG